MYCSHCGFELSENAKFCSKCGIKVSTEQASPITYPSAVTSYASETEFPVAVSQVRPWVRFFARTFDIWLLDLTFAIACLMMSITIRISTNFLVGMILPVIWLFIEPVFLSKWGATPGKLLLRTRVTKQNGELLSYGEALSRSVNVWLKGEALYIPVVILVANIVAYKRLTKHGITTWDKSGSFLVRHSRIGDGRVVFFVFLFVALFVATFQISGAIISLR